MAISSACYVVCDGLPGRFCHMPAEVTTSGSKDARKIALAEGFVRVRQKGKLVDLCSECAQAASNTNTEESSN